MTFNNEKTAGGPSVEAGEATIEEEDVMEEATDNTEHTKLQDNITCSPGELKYRVFEMSLRVKLM